MLKGKNDWIWKPCMFPSQKQNPSKACPSLPKTGGDPVPDVWFDTRGTLSYNACHPCKHIHLVVNSLQRRRKCGPAEILSEENYQRLRRATFVGIWGPRAAMAKTFLEKRFPKKTYIVDSKRKLESWPDVSVPSAPSAPSSLSSPSAHPLSSVRDIDDHPMSHVHEHIYIGNIYNANDSKLLKEHGITRVVSITPSSVSVDSDVEHIVHAIPDSDVPPETMIDLFSKVTDLLTDPQRTLVHCDAGISRSVTIVASFLIKHKKMPMGMALDLIHSKRPIASPNLHFLGMLLKWSEHCEAAVTQTKP